MLKRIIKLLLYLAATLLLLIILLFGVLFYIGILPFEDSQPIRTDKVTCNTPDILVSKEANAFLFQYKPVSFCYNDITVSVESAFAEKTYFYYKYAKDSIIVQPDAIVVHVRYKNHRILKYKGYRETWIIDNQELIAEEGLARYNFEGTAPDTIACYVRECHPSPDTLGTTAYSEEAKNQIKWDTVQCFLLIRDKEDSIEE